MRKIIFAFVISVLSFVGIHIYAQTVLSPGDIFIVTVNSNPDFVEFVPRVDLQTGTVIYFSDNAWSGNNTWRTGEGAIVFTATSLIPAGKVISVSGLDVVGVPTIDPSLGTVTRDPNTAAGFNIATAGDQVFIYQGSDTIDNSASFVYGIGLNTSTPWITSGTPTPNNSYLPLPLSTGINAFTYTPASHRSIQYTCINRNMSDPAFRSGLYDISCWSGNTSGSYFGPITGDFTIDQAPVVTLNGSGTMTIPRGFSYTEQGATWIDDVDGSGSIPRPTSGSINPRGLPGTYYLEYTRIDTAGNTGIATRAVTISDPPIPDPQDDYYMINQDTDLELYIWPNLVTINDSGAQYATSGGALIYPTYGSVILTGQGFVYVPNTGFVGIDTTIYQLCNIINQCGTGLVTITVLDTTPPVVILSGNANISIEVGSSYTEQGATWTDNADGSGIITIPTSGSVNANMVGTYTLEYTYVDMVGNTGNTVTRVVNVVDTTPPVVILSGNANISIEVGSSYTEQGATWTDNADGSGIITIPTSGSVNANMVGTYTLEYTYVDMVGNTGNTVTRVVNVVDTTPPVVTLVGSPTETVQAGSSFIDHGAACTDNVSCIVTQIGSVNTNSPGTYTITYTATDPSGNTGSITRTVIVDNWMFAGGGNGSNSNITSQPQQNNNALDKSIFNPSIDPDTCFAPMENLTINKGNMSPYQQIAHQMLYSYGLTTIPNTLDFAPNRMMTRAEAAKFLVQFAQNVLCRSKIHTYDNRFTDIDKSHPDLQTNIKLSYEYGIFYGSEGGLFRPDDFITKDELIAVMIRLITNRYDDLTGTNRADNYKKTLSILSSMPLNDTTRGSISEVLYDLYKNNNYKLESAGYTVNK